MRKRKFNWRKWLDEWRLAGRGAVLATENRKFLGVAGAGFLVFGTVMNLLASGTAGMTLFGVASWGGKIKILGDSLLGLFGVGRNFWDFLLIFAISLLQGVLIGLVALVWKKRKDNADNLQRAGLAAGLAVLGSGCPTCGSTLLAPLIGAISSSGGLALAGTLSGLLTVGSFVLALFAFKKLGFEAYVIIVDEKFKHKKEANAG